ncbi:MAG: hypothetical protein SGPRY_007136 [Prymnesium sp.]
MLASRTSPPLHSELSTSHTHAPTRPRARDTQSTLFVLLAVNEPSDIEQSYSDVLSSRERNCANLDTLLNLGEQKVYDMLKKFELTSDETTLFMLNYTICRNMVLYDHTYKTLAKLPDWLQDIQSAANAHNKTKRRRSSTPRIKRELHYAE